MTVTPRQPPRGRAIIQMVAQRHGLRVRDILDNNRTRHIVKVRCEAMHEVRRLTHMSLPEMGRIFNRDHTTVLHALRRWEQHWSKL